MAGNRGPFSQSQLVNLVLEQMREILAIKARLNEFRTLQALYPQWNENTPAQITAHQNNYDPGNYGVLRLSSDAGRNISGFQSGTKGRILLIFNVGGSNITLLHENAGSDAANRIRTETGGNVIIMADDHQDLYYDSTIQRWRTFD